MGDRADLNGSSVMGEQGVERHNMGDDTDLNLPEVQTIPSLCDGRWTDGRNGPSVRNFFWPIVDVGRTRHMYPDKKKITITFESRVFGRPTIQRVDNGERVILQCRKSILVDPEVGSPVAHVNVSNDSSTCLFKRSDNSRIGTLHKHSGRKRFAGLFSRGEDPVWSLMDSNQKKLLEVHGEFPQYCFMEDQMDTQERTMIAYTGEYQECHRASAPLYLR